MQTKGAKIYVLNVQSIFLKKHCCTQTIQETETICH